VTALIDKRRPADQAVAAPELLECGHWWPGRPRHSSSSPYARDPAFESINVIGGITAGGAI